MKLVLANNQTERFVSFYGGLRAQSNNAFDYAGYEDLLFLFDIDAKQSVCVWNAVTGTSLDSYDGVYLNGYLDTYELAATTATCCQALSIPFVNGELADAPSLSKLTAYAKLTRDGVRIPRTLAGTKAALLQSQDVLSQLVYPQILKRADADRGIDNYKMHDADEIIELIEGREARSLWIVQEYIDNDGFYLVSFYDGQPEFSIFRSLEERPDGNERKAHMYKPKGGANASLIDLKDMPQPIMAVCQAAVNSMRRQIGSVDCLYDKKTGKVRVLEVNYNPQLVTIETFKDIRIKSFLNGINKIH